MPLTDYQQYHHLQLRTPCMPAPIRVDFRIPGVIQGLGIPTQSLSIVDLAMRAQLTVAVSESKETTCIGNFAKHRGWVSLKLLNGGHCAVEESPLLSGTEIESQQHDRHQM